MPVPAEDIVCRFLRPADWSRRDQRPRPGAFKDRRGISVWHRERLRQQAVALEDLLIEHLAGWGQAQHRAGDYAELAAVAAQQEGQFLQVQVEWRPEDEYVAPAWRQWRYAHAQAETEIVDGAAEVLIEFRRLLAINSRLTVPPAQYANP